MKLEIKHLASYLPYSLKVMMEGKKCNVAWMSTKHIAVIRPNILGEIKKIKWEYAHLNIRPILKHIETLTIEEKIDVWGSSKTYVGKSVIDSKDGFYDNWILPLKYIKDHGYDDVNYRTINRLLSKKIDMFGLIEKGLAIDINTL